MRKTVKRRVVYEEEIPDVWFAMFLEAWRFLPDSKRKAHLGAIAMELALCQDGRVNSKLLPINRTGD